MRFRERRDVADESKTVQFTCPVPLPAKDTVLLGHGSGGKLTADLIRDLFLPAFSNPVLARLDDQAIVSLNGLRLAFTTDSFVVKPLFFPGGDIGKLAVNGTVNDLAVSGAEPLYLSAGFILEEGLEIEVLHRVAESMAVAAKEAGVEIVAADTKVVERGKGDGVFINTAGVGRVLDGVELSPQRAQPGDQILLTGTLGDHGIAVYLARQDLGIEVPVQSDCAPLSTMLLPLLRKFGKDIRFMRDLTRGGAATILNEFATQAGRQVLVSEAAIPVSPAVCGACEMLGFDPLYLANEGKAMVVVAHDAAEDALSYINSNALGRRAARVGEVRETEKGGSPLVLLRTGVGGLRLLDPLIEDQLPRIC